MKLWKTMLVAVTAVALSFATSGCDDDDIYYSDHTEFNNMTSSAVITVRPSHDEAFDSFVLDPGEWHRVRRIGSRIGYSYSSTKPVHSQNLDELEVLFTDPQE